MKVAGCLSSVGKPLWRLEAAVRLDGRRELGEPIAKGPHMRNAGMLNALTHEPVASEPARPSQDARLARALVAHFEFVWRLLLRLGVEPGRVQDEAQRVFEILHGKLDQVPESHVRPFLSSVAFGVAANARRSQQRRREEPRGDEIDKILDGAPSPEELVERKRHRELLDRILDQLSLEQRAVLVLSELEGMSRREIARHLDLPVGTVSSRLRLAKEHFDRLAARLHAELYGSRERRNQ